MSFEKDYRDFRIHLKNKRQMISLPVNISMQSKIPSLTIIHTLNVLRSLPCTHNEPFQS